jgi:hypothetical protein
VEVEDEGCVMPLVQDCWRDGDVASLDVSLLWSPDRNVENRGSDS